MQHMQQQKATAQQDDIEEDETISKAPQTHKRKNEDLEHIDSTAGRINTNLFT